MKINYSLFVPSLIFPLVIGIISSFLVMDGINEFYFILAKPPLTPPIWLFIPLWPIIYISMGLALYIFLNTKGKLEDKQKGLFFFLVELVFDFIWSFIVFNWHSMAGGLVDLILMTGLTMTCMYYFNKISRKSALYLSIYFIWILFATYLNAGILLLNP